MLNIYPGDLTNTKTNRGLEGNIEIDGESRYRTVAKVRVTETGNSLKISPQFELHTRNENSLNLTGNIDFRKGKFVKVDLISHAPLIRTSDVPITLKGNIFVIYYGNCTTCSKIRLLCRAFRAAIHC